MKNLIFIFSFLMLTGAYAQEKKPIDKMEETTTTKTTINNNGEEVSENTVKVTTKKEQLIKTKQLEGNTTNGYKVDTPIKVTKMIQIDRDSDPFYDIADKTVYYNLNGEKFTLTSNSNGFLMATPSDISYGEAMKSASNHFYLMTIKGHPGVGYFDSNGNLIVEYYDKVNNVMMMESYEMNKF